VSAVLLRVVAALAFLAPAAAQVISIDESGNSKIFCTPSQNPGVKGPVGAAVPRAYRTSFERAGLRYQISPDLLEAVARQESAYNPHAISPKGAIGIMQLLPATARAFGADPYDVQQNINAGAAYLRYLLNVYDGRIDLALGAYNAGQSAIARFGGIPPFNETRIYLLRNFENLAQKSDLELSMTAASREPGYIQICRR
jgi:soluble lytic murein transglycosylase-like protein